MNRFSRTSMSSVATKRFVFLAAVLLLSTISIVATGTAASMEDGWNKVPEILSRIVPPTFPDRDFWITNYGAVGDGTTDCNAAFKKAIADCTSSGGGRVVVPVGTFLTNGPIHLDDNVNLHVSKGATIKFGTDTEDYKPYVLVRWEGTECYNYSPLIYAYKKKNLAITGSGTIDGQAKNAWALWKKKQDDDKTVLRQMGNDLVPVKKRVFGDGHYLRPAMIQPFECKNILIENVTLKDSPFWIIQPTYCSNVTVRGVTVRSLNTNNDGCDPDSSTDVLIEKCNFYSGDDSVAIKAGRDQDAWRVGRPSENIIVRNCKLNSLCNGLCIGSEMSGGVRNVFLENCTLDETGSLLFFKSNLDRGGAIENVWVRNIKAGSTERAVRFMNDYHGYRGGNYPTRFRNFLIENVSCEKASRCGIHIVGVKGADIENVTLRNVTINDAKQPTQIKYIKNVVFDNVKINGIMLPEHPSN